jgi:hypothetical protein
MDGRGSVRAICLKAWQNPANLPLNGGKRIKLVAIGATNPFLEFPRLTYFLSTVVGATHCYHD